MLSRRIASRLTKLVVLALRSVQTEQAFLVDLAENKRQEEIDRIEAGQAKG